MPAAEDARCSWSPLTRLVLLALAVFCGAGRISDAETVQWSDPENNGRNNYLEATGLPAELTEENLLWEVDLRGRWHFARPTVSGGRVFLGVHVSNLQDEAIKAANPSKHAAGVVCLEQSTGEVLWELAISRGSGVSYGVVSPGVIEGSHYYIRAGTNVLCLDVKGQADGNDGPFTDELTLMTKAPGAADAVREGRTVDPLTELKPTYGDVIWHVDLGELGVRTHDAGAGTPLLDGDLLWVNTSHAMGIKPAPAWHKEEHEWHYRPAPNIVALDKETGRVVATDDLQIPRVFHSQWSSVSMGVVDGRKLLFCGDGYGVLHAFAVPDDLSGKQEEVTILEEVWHYDANPPEYRRDEQGELPFPGHGVQKKEGVRGVVVGPQHILATPVFHEGRVYVTIGRDRVYNARDRGRIAGPGMISCVDASAKGEIEPQDAIWRSKEIGRTQSTPSIEDGLLYIADMGGYLRCFDADTGELLWKEDLEVMVLERSQMLADGKLYVATKKNELFVFKAGRKPQLLWETRLRDMLATPTAAGGMVLLCARRRVAAYGNPGEAATALAPPIQR